MPKIVPKSLQTCFEHVLGQTSRKIFAQFSMECRVFENFQKKYIFKTPKMPKSVPKSIQTCFRVIFSKKKLCPVFHGGSSFRKLSKIFFSKLQKCPKSFPKVSKHVLNMCWGKLFENFFPQCSVEGRVFKNFQNFFFQNSKNAQKCSQKYPNVL